MTIALRATAPDETEPPDWAVSYRIMRGEDPRCEPTAAEVRLAVWLLLDRGLTRNDIFTRTIASEYVTNHVYRLRELASRPDWEEDHLGELTPQLARFLYAPTDVERAMLEGEGLKP